MNQGYYDQKLATEAQAIEQAAKLGGVVIQPKRTGFARPESAPPPPKPQDAD